MGIEKEENGKSMSKYQTIIVYEIIMDEIRYY